MGEVVLPEVGGMQMAIDEHHQHKDVYQHSLTVLRQAIALEDDGPDLVLRWAALLHDIGKPATRRHEPDGGVSFHHHEVVGAKMVRKRLRALKYSKQMVDDISQLVYLHLRFHGYGDGKWTDSAVRRYVTDAGPLLPRLHKLVRADCTTRNKRRAARLQANYDRLEARIAELAAQEDLARVRPDLDGNQIMELLDIPAGPQVGEAWRFLKELRLERGPLTTEEATRRAAGLVAIAAGTRSGGDASDWAWIIAWLATTARRIWHGQPDLDLDGDGRLDAIGLDFDGDGMRDDALADLDGDGSADHAVLDLDNDGTPESYFTDDGSGTWAVAVDRDGQLRWFGLDGVEHTGGPLVDFDGHGRADDRLLDTDGNGVADRVLCAGENGVTGYVDTDGDGKWNVRLTDSDGDGLADGASAL